MLLSEMPTMVFTSSPLKSGGEFFIRASQGGAVLQLAIGASITALQPFGAFAADSNMAAFVGVDSGAANLWVPPPIIDSVGHQCTVATNATDYVFSLYQFSMPEDSGTWCNSDNQTYFSSYPQTNLTLNPTDNPDTFQTTAFLVFKNIDCMVHVYINGNDFPYQYAPQGLQCTIVEWV